MLIVVLAAALGVSAVYILIYKMGGLIKRDKLYFQTSRIPLDQLPDGFIQDVSIPVPTDAILVENTSTKLPDGRIWATRSYETNVPLATLRDDYEKYLKTLGRDWAKPDTHQRGKDTFVLSAQRNKKLLVISLSKSETKNLVKITFADAK